MGYIMSMYVFTPTFLVQSKPPCSLIWPLRALLFLKERPHSGQSTGCRDLQEGGGRREEGGGGREEGGGEMRGDTLVEQETIMSPTELKAGGGFHLMLMWAMVCPECYHLAPVPCPIMQSSLQPTSPL